MHLRRTGLLGTLALAALVLPGCIAIKSQTTSQATPGVVSLDLVICATDRNRQIDSDPNNPPAPVPYPDCDPDGSDGTPQNTAEQSDSGDMEDNEQKAQILVAYRVPIGSEGPQSFQSQAQDMTFNRSPTYEAALNDPDNPDGTAPPEGFHWVGYISTPRDFDLVNDPSSRSATLKALFTLPPGPSGAPYAGPLPWRPVTGLRLLASVGEAGEPVVCGDGSTNCIESPLTAVIPTNLEATVSDFAIRQGAATSAGHGETAAVTFKIDYSDPRGLGAREFDLVASTTIPGAGPVLGSPTVTIEPDTSATVTVNVPVPAGTQLGTYSATLRASTGDPEAVRSNTGTIEVVDKIAPTVSLGSPPDGAIVGLNQEVKADYSCSDELNGSGVATCAGPVPSGSNIDTASPGTKTFTVTGTDKAGNTRVASRSYTVVAPPPPRITSSVTNFWRFFRKYTRVTTLRVNDLPEGSTLRLKCGKGRKKKGCPFRTKRIRAVEGGDVNLTKHFLKKPKGKKGRKKKGKPAKIRVGAKIEIRMTAPGHFGRVVTFKIRRSKAPKPKVTCLNPDSDTKTAC